jgi:release factor glutamine methyltransferase
VLDQKGFATAALDAKLLTGHALGLAALDMATREHEAADTAAVERVALLLQRRLSGESVARIIGEREFYGLPFTLNAATLEPRPETEQLVDLAVAALPAGGRLLDLGTGTGCIAIAMLANRPDATAVAVDLSAEALDAAQENAERHGVAGRLTLLQGSWFSALTPGGPHGEPVEPRGRAEDGATTLSFDRLRIRSDERSLFDLVISNPPYITSAVVETLAPEVRDFDPHLALDGGPDGLAPYRVIAGEAAQWLTPGGCVLVEIGHDQGEAVSALLVAAGFADVTVKRDLNGLDRVVCAHHLGDSHRTAR